MPRGGAAKVGDERTAPNGYQYVKVAERGWVLKHWLIWEAANGRLVDPRVETVRFIDGNKNNLAPENITTIPKGTTSLRARIARLEVLKGEIEGQLAYYRRELEKASSESA